MKKIVVVLLILFSAQTEIRACDICGCGVGTSYIGILPDFHKHIIGLRYRQNSLLTHVGVGGSSSYLTTREQYKTLELWGGWNIGSKFRVMTSIPYSFNERINQGVSLRKNGPGDMSVSGFFNLINSRKAVKEKLAVQSLWLGAGIKAPAGKYNPLDKGNSTDNANLFQLGTGSFDFTVNAMYDLRLNDIGLSASALYKINTQNKYDYAYGNKLSINGQIYHKFRIKNFVTIAPNAGASFETAAKDSDRKVGVDISGGNLTMGTFGVEATFSSVSIGGNYQRPISQNLANGIVKASDRFMVHVSFLL